MENIKTSRIIFNLPEETTIIDAINQILQNNKLSESPKDFFNKYKNHQEPILIVIRDAAYVMAEKKIPEKKIIDLLVEHLETTPETAEKIVAEINEKLIPFAKIVGEKPEEVEAEDFSKELAEEIQRKQAEPQIQPDTLKPAIPKPIIPKAPVPPSAPVPQQNIPQPPKEVSKVKTVLPPEAAKPNPADTYREPIE